MVTYQLNFLLSIIHWENLDNCKVWTESSMVMLGADCRPVILRIPLNWVSKQQNALDICVVKMILILYFIILMCAMKFLGMGIVCNLKNISNVSWNPWFVTLVISFVILLPHVYKLVMLKCIILFISFQIFQEPWSTWAPMPIQLQIVSVDNPFKRWRTRL